MFYGGYIANGSLAHTRLHPVTIFVFMLLEDVVHAISVEEDVWHLTQGLGFLKEEIL